MTAEHATRNRLLSPLGVRLAAAFVTVAVAAVAVIGILSIVGARDEVSQLVGEVHSDDARSAAAAAGSAYEDAMGWDGADLSSAIAVAARGQATLAVADANGTLIAAPADEAAEMLQRMHGVNIIDVPRGEPVTEPVVVDGEQVGTIALRVPVQPSPRPRAPGPGCARPHDPLRRPASGRRRRRRRGVRRRPRRRPDHGPHQRRRGNRNRTP